MSAEGDEMIRKLRIALAETGYGDAELIEEYQHGRYAFPQIASFHTPPIPDDVWYRAASLCLPRRVPWPCWSCYFRISGDGDRHQRCAVGNCQAGPDTPKVPPKRVR